MKTPVKVRWTKFCILSLLLWGALLPAYACPPEVDKAVAQLQKSARANISAEDWLVQIVDETSTFDSLINLRSKGPLEFISGAEIVQKKLWAALFENKRSLVYLRKYLAEVEIRQNDDRDRSAFREFVFNGETITYSYSYPSRNPFSDSNDISLESACQLEIVINMAQLIFDNGQVIALEETAFFYTFKIVAGKMKLTRLGMVG